MDDLLKDIRFGARLLLRDRGFTAAALLTLALCIGANTAIFSVIHSVLLRPLPYLDADRLVTLYNSYPNAGAVFGSNSVPDYYDRKREIAAFSSVALYQGQGFTVGEQGSPERVTGFAVTPGFFHLLGIQPALGRGFTEQEAEPGNDRVAVLGYGLWQARFAGRRDVIGTDVRVGGTPYTIVGVMPRGFDLEDRDARLWVPLAFTPRQKSDESRHSNSWSMIARLRDGATLEQARAQIDALNQRNLDRFPKYRDLIVAAGYHTVVEGFRAELTSDVAGTLYLLQAGVLIVLLIGCVNIANLVLVRSGARTREIATRFALGAGRMRMARQLLTESLLLALGGGALGIAAGYGGVRAIVALAGNDLPRSAEIGMHLPVLVAALVLSLGAGLLFGTIPIVRMLRGDLSSVFRDEGRTGTAGRAALAARGALVITQVALAFALLVSAGLIITSFEKTLDVEPGFHTDHLLTAAIALPAGRYSDDAARHSLAQRLLASVRTLPGVTGAAVASALPFGDDFSSSVITPEGYTLQPGESPISPLHSEVSPGYFEGLGIKLVRGRTFNESDTNASPRVVIIDEWLAHRFWPGVDPIGRRLVDDVPDPSSDSIPWATIVGITRSVRAISLAGEQPPGHYYFPESQSTLMQPRLVVRTAGDPIASVPAVRSALTKLDPDLPLYDTRSMAERISASLVTERARMVLLLVFAGVALFLAATGIYGMLAYTVSLRTREIGIRMALGSGTTDVFRLVVGQGVRLLVIGLALGIGGSLLLTRFLRTLLFGVAPTDPRVFAGVLAILGAVALAACVLPARRAARIHPMRALSAE